MSQRVKRGKELPTAVLTTFFEQMHMFLASGINIWEGLSIMSENAKSPQEVRAYSKMYDTVLEGASLADAMEEANCFPSYAIGMSRIGEQTGRMDQTADALRTYYAERDVLSQSIKSAVMYPLCMAAMVLTVVFVLIVQVMPVFEQVFAQLGLELNTFAVTMMSIGETLTDSAMVILSALCVVIVLGILVHRTQKGKAMMASFFEVFPLTRKVTIAREANSFAFSTSLMLGSGMEPLTAFDFALTLAEGKHARTRIQKLSDLVVDGQTLSNAIINCGIFAPSYHGVVVAGTRAGSTEGMLMNIAKRYHDETQQRVQQLLGIIEPSLVAVLCIMTGLVMLSVMLPLMGIMAGMQL